MSALAAVLAKPLTRKRARDHGLNVSDLRPDVPEPKKHRQTKASGHDEKRDNSSSSSAPADDTKESKTSDRELEALLEMDRLQHPEEETECYTCKKELKWNLRTGFSGRAFCANYNCMDKFKRTCLVCSSETLEPSRMNKFGNIEYVCKNAHQWFTCEQHDWKSAGPQVLGVCHCLATGAEPDALDVIAYVEDELHKMPVMTKALKLVRAIGTSYEIARDTVRLKSQNKKLGHEIKKLAREEDRPAKRLIPSCRGGDKCIPCTRSCMCQFCAAGKTHLCTCDFLSGDIDDGGLNPCDFEDCIPGTANCDCRECRHGKFETCGCK